MPLLHRRVGVPRQHQSRRRGDHRVHSLPALRRHGALCTNRELRLDRGVRGSSPFGNAPSVANSGRLIVSRYVTEWGFDTSLLPPHQSRWRGMRRIRRFARGLKEVHHGSGKERRAAAALGHRRNPSPRPRGSQGGPLQQGSRSIHRISSLTPLVPVRLYNHGTHG
jgi:hypothetical protein